MKICTFAFCINKIKAKKLVSFASLLFAMLSICNAQRNDTCQTPELIYAGLENVKKTASQSLITQTDEIVKRLKRLGVTRRLTIAEEKSFSVTLSYLGEDNIGKVLEALRNSVCPPSSPSPSPTAVPTPTPLMLPNTTLTPTLLPTGSSPTVQIKPMIYSIYGADIPIGKGSTVTFNGKGLNNGSRIVLMNRDGVDLFKVYPDCLPPRFQESKQSLDNKDGYLIFYLYHCPLMPPGIVKVFVYNGDTQNKSDEISLNFTKPLDVRINNIEEVKVKGRWTIALNVRFQDDYFKQNTNSQNAVIAGEVRKGDIILNDGILHTNYSNALEIYHKWGLEQYLPAVDGGEYQIELIAKSQDGKKEAVGKNLCTFNANNLNRNCNIEVKQGDKRAFIARLRLTTYVS